jgi:signal transduction histidine kinase
VTRSTRLRGHAAWHPGCRALLGAAALAGLAGAPTLLFAVVVAVLIGAYGALVAGRDRVRLRWWGWVGADLAVLAGAAWLLAQSDLLAVAVLLPALVAAAAGTELGQKRALEVAAIATGTLALTQVVGPGPDPSWRTAVAVGAAGVLAGWAGLAGAAVREDTEARLAERRSLEELKEQVVTTVSHELRTPLTIIQGLSSTLVSRWDSLPETRRLDLVDSLGVNVASLDASVLHFLDAGRLSRGGWEVRAALVEVEPLVDAVLAKLDPVLAGHEVSCRLDAAQVWADPVALGRVLELLLVNACRFSPPAGSIGVRVSGSMADGWEVSVADRGQGISPADLPKIFDRLWRADVQETGVSRGAGLGLAIVKELAERHGGTATASSAKGRGSTFRISLPAPPPGAGV